MGDYVVHRIDITDITHIDITHTVTGLINLIDSAHNPWLNIREAWVRQQWPIRSAFKEQASIDFR